MRVLLNITTTIIMTKKTLTTTQMDGFLSFLVPTVIRRAAENNRFLAAAGNQTMHAMVE